MSHNTRFVVADVLSTGIVVVFLVRPFCADTTDTGVRGTEGGIVLTRLLLTILYRYIGACSRIFIAFARFGSTVVIIVAGGVLFTDEIRQAILSVRITGFTDSDGAAISSLTQRPLVQGDASAGAVLAGIGRTAWVIVIALLIVQRADIEGTNPARTLFVRTRIIIVTIGCNCAFISLTGATTAATSGETK
jgi:hypothetical protein